MTYEDLRAVAARNGSVRWDKSGLVENLFLSKKKTKVVARPLMGSETHVIWEHLEDYLCTELTAEVVRALNAYAYGE
jgi:hypothetical protein